MAQSSKQANDRTCSQSTTVKPERKSIIFSDLLTSQHVCFTSLQAEKAKNGRQMGKTKNKGKFGLKWEKREDRKGRW